MPLPAELNGQNVSNRASAFTSNDALGLAAEVTSSVQPVDPTEHATLMLQALPKLAQDATESLKLIQELVAFSSNMDALASELRDGTSKVWHMFMNRIAALQQSFKLFTLTENDASVTSYIRPESVLQVLFDVQHISDVSKAGQKVSEVLFLANLAHAVNRLMMLDPAIDKDVIAEMEAMDAGFPTHFFSELQSTQDSVGSSSLSQASFYFGLNLRAQLLIRSWKIEFKDENFEPAISESPYFYLTDGTKKMWNVPVWQDEKNTYIKQYEEFVGTLGSFIGEDATIDFKKVEQTFSWTQFETQLCGWALGRFKELLDQLKHKGGADKVIADLQTEVATQQALRDQSNSAEFPAKRRAFTKRLHARGRLSLDPSATANIDPALENDEVSSQGRLRVTDRQDTADRVPWDDSQEQPQHIPINSSNSNPLEGFDGSSGPNVTQDAGFQNDDADDFQLDTRPSAQVARPPRRQATNTADRSQVATPTSTRKRAADATPGDQPRAVRARVAQGPAAANAEEDDDDDPDMPPPSTLYATANAQSRRVTSRANVAKPPQTRRGWTSEEVDQLHYLIAEHGVSWSQIVRADELGMNVFANRGDGNATKKQVTLKDKARNMKFDYLK